MFPVDFFQDLKRVLALDWLMKKCSKIDTLLFYVLKGTIDSHWLEILKILHYNWSCTVEEGALLKSTVLNILESTIDLPKLDHFEAEKRLQVSFDFISFYTKFMNFYPKRLKYSSIFF